MRIVSFDSVYIMVNNMDAFNSEVDALKVHFDANCHIKEFSAHSAKVHSVGWSCDGRKLASGSFDKSVVVCSLDREKLSLDVTFKGHSASVDQLRWHRTHPDLLATASGDKTARIWDARSQKCVTSVATPGENINIAWAPDGSAFAVGNKEDLVTFFDARTYRKISEEQFQLEVNEISWNKRSDLFFLTNGQGSVIILSYPELEQQQIIKAHPGTCICIDFDLQGKYFAVGSADALVSLWDVENLACIRTFSRLDWPVRSISFSHDAKLIASGSEDHLIDVGVVSSGEMVRQIPVEASVFTLAWHPKQYLLAYACDEQSDRKRDTGTLKVFGFPGES